MLIKSHFTGFIFVILMLAAAQGCEKPNMIMLMPTLAAMWVDDVKTPNMDRLAEGGMRISVGYCTPRYRTFHSAVGW